MYSSRQRKRVLIQFVVLVGLMMVIGSWVSQIDQVQQLFTQAAYVPADVVIHTRAVLGPLPRPWRNLAQGGESHAWRIEPIAGAVAQLNPEYIRLDHIYDFYDVVSGTPGNLQLNFSKLDLVLNDIRAVGATPFISLSYMPSVLSDGDITGKPRSYSDWQYLVQKTIEHISGDLGFQDVYYEVWNEPDLFGGWKYYGDKNYLDLYAAAARGAAAASGTSAFKFGGPATTGLYKSWVDALLSYTTKHDLRLDFISWHSYSDDIEQYKQDMQNAERWLSNYPQYYRVVELLITEWGINSELDPRYDNMLAATHTVAGSIAMTSLVNKSFIFEIQDGNNPSGAVYWGRWGLLTSNESGALEKPRYQALQMLDQLADQQLFLLGQGKYVKALAALTNNGTIQLIVANYDPNNSNFEVVPLTFQAILPGNYQLKTHYLSGSTRIDKAATTSATLQMSLPLSPNDVAFTELIRE